MFLDISKLQKYCESVFPVHGTTSETSHATRADHWTDVDVAKSRRVSGQNAFDHRKFACLWVLFIKAFIQTGCWIVFERRNSYIAQKSDWHYLSLCLSEIHGQVFQYVTKILQQMLTIIIKKTKKKNSSSNNNKLTWTKSDPCWQAGLILAVPGCCFGA